MICVGYKVVRRDYTSCVAEGKYKLHYPLGKVAGTVEGTLGIMVFDAYASAYRFALSDQYILLVTYNSNDINKWSGLMSAYTSELALHQYYNSKAHSTPLLDGVVLCSKVKVIAKEEALP